MSTLQCLSRDALKEYLSGWTDAQQSDAIELHLNQCSDCEQTITALEKDSETLIEYVRNVRNPASSESPVADSAVAYALGRSKKLLAKVDEQTVPWQPPVGDFGPYELLRPLGHGGMATVYLARHRQLGKQVAIKLLPSRPFRNDHYAARFQREIRTAGQLNHPAIVSATDAGEQAGTHYLVMEYIDGLDLSRVARLHGPLGIADACAIMRTVAIGLSHAHAEGIVHRDIKPSNLMLSIAGDVKILDFGLAQVNLWDECSAELTTVGQLMGTLDYMAPEQAERPEAVDYRADLYSMGATLFRLLCGRAPLAAAPDLSPLVKLRLLASHQPPRLDTLRPDAPKKLVDFVTQLLARNPDDRPASAAHVAEQLSQFTESADLKSLITTVQSKANQTSETEASLTRSKSLRAQVSSSESGRRISRWWLAASLLPLFIVAGVMITLETQKGQLVIESENANVDVKLLRGGEVYDKLEIAPGVNTTRLYAGKYEVVIDASSDSVTFDQPEIEIKRGQTLIARVSVAKAVSSEVVGDRSFIEGLPSSGMRLRANDQVVVVSAQDASLNYRVLVMSDLTIKLPLVGVISVENETVESLQAKLRKEYEQYLKNPAIEVFLEKANPSTNTKFVIDSATDPSGRPPKNRSPLTPGDSIVVVSMSDPKLIAQAVVLADSTIRLPLVGNVKVGLETVEDLESRLDELYSVHYKKPQIEVFRVILSDKGREVAERAADPEPIYEGKTLSDWLEQFARERSPVGTNSALEAIGTLVSESSAKRVEKVLLDNLRSVGNRWIGEGDKSKPIDREAFPILARCFTERKDYFAMLATELQSGDEEWATRILKSSVERYSWRPEDVVPLVAWVEESVLKVKKSSELTLTATKLFQDMLDGTDSTPEYEPIKNRLVDSLTNSEQLGLDFWLSRRPHYEGNQFAGNGNVPQSPFRPFYPRFASAIESKAIGAILDDKSTDVELIEAVAMMNALNSQAYDRKGMAARSVATELLLAQAIGKRFASQMADEEHRMASATLRAGFNGLRQQEFRGPLAFVRMKVAADIKVYEKTGGTGGWAQSGITNRNIALELLDCIEILKLQSSLQPQLRLAVDLLQGKAQALGSILDATSSFRPGRFDLTISLDRLDAPIQRIDEKVTGEDILEYIIFSKAFRLLPDAEREKIDSEYWSKLNAKVGEDSLGNGETKVGQPDPAMLDWSKRQIAKYDKNRDGSLTVDEWSSMIAKPDGADRNKDGVITAEELAEPRRSPK